jgi:hypothetical protein
MFEVTWRTQSCVQGRDSSRPFLAGAAECRLDSRHRRLDSPGHDTGLDDGGAFFHV